MKMFDGHPGEIDKKIVKADSKGSHIFFLRHKLDLSMSNIGQKLSLKNHVKWPILKLFMYLACTCLK